MTILREALLWVACWPTPLWRVPVCRVTCGPVLAFDSSQRWLILIFFFPSSYGFPGASHVE